MLLPHSFSLKTILSCVFFIALIVLGYLFYNELSGYLTAISQISWMDILILLLLSCLSYIFRSIKYWFGLIELNSDAGRCDYQKVSFIYFYGFAFSFLPGKLGDLVRLPYLSQIGVRYSVSLATTFLDRFYDLIVVTFLSLMILSKEFPNIYLLMSALLLVPVIIRLFPLDSLLKTWLDRVGLNDSALEIQQKILTGFTGGIAFKFIVVSFLVWVAQGAGLWWLLQTYGYEFSFFHAIGIYCAALIMGMLSMIPGGIGVTEASIVGMLLLFEVPLEIAISVSILSRLTTFWFAVAVGLGSRIVVTKHE